jgi:thiamine-phosphate pyrophosphorylase
VDGFRILLIADTARAAAGAVDRALRALPAGAAAVQLRDRAASGWTLWAAADRLAAVRRRVDARLLINDRADVALAVGADGIHLPRHGASVAECRALGIATVGVSTHAIDEVREAARDGADYVVFGPVFETPGKGPPLGLAALERAAALGVPVFALGGVDARNAAACLRAGAAGVACIRAVLDAADPGSAARRLFEAVRA